MIPYVCFVFLPIVGGGWKNGEGKENSGREKGDKRD
jgi:hypothetical protein